MSAANNISVVIPTLKAPRELFKLLRQLAECPELEVIVVNQSKKSLLKDVVISNLTEIYLGRQVSASIARNIGAEISKSEFIFFLDDDAFFSNDSHKLLSNVIDLKKYVDCFIFDRGFLRSTTYVSVNPASTRWRSTHWSITKYVTEWNICVRRTLFTEVGGFPEVGVGSPHLSQSGEVFILLSRLFHKSKSFFYANEIAISHPPAWSKKPYLTCIGYYYGAGYAIGVGLREYQLSYRIIWYIRTILAVVRDFLTPMDSILGPVEAEITIKKYKASICWYRLLGLADSINQRNPRRKP
jgi:glycosyltransferase involved in cell wall biosynthesis